MSDVSKPGDRECREALVRDLLEGLRPFAEARHADMEGAAGPAALVIARGRISEDDFRKAQALILRAGNLGSSGANECGAGSQANLADPGGGSFDGCEPTAVTEAIELATAGLKRGDPPAIVIRDLLKALGRPAPSRPDCSAAQSLDGKGAA